MLDIPDLVAVYGGSGGGLGEGPSVSQFLKQAACSSAVSFLQRGIELFGWRSDSWHSCILLRYI
jgi:hypothetical protein